jgi:hypothetical protein
MLKYPTHLMALDVLLETYPDARLIWTHRDPAVVVTSVVSFTGFMRASMTSDFDPPRFGREWATFEELVLLRGLSVRDRISDAGTRIYDLHYQDLMRDPVGSIGAVMKHFDLPFSAASADGVGRFVEAHPKGEHGPHRYDPSDFGLEPERLRERFAFYTERFGVAAETAR